MEINADIYSSLLICTVHRYAKDVIYGCYYLSFSKCLSNKSDRVTLCYMGVCRFYFPTRQVRVRSKSLSSTLNTELKTLKFIHVTAYKQSNLPVSIDFPVERRASR